MTMRILLADDHKIMREGIRALIAGQPDMTVIAEAEDGLSAVRLATELSPDIIIMDIAMPGLSGIEATRQITAAGTGLKNHSPLDECRPSCGAGDAPCRRIGVSFEGLRL